MKAWFKLAFVLLCLSGLSVFRAAGQSSVKDTLEFDKALAASPADMLKGKVSGVNVSSLDGGINGVVSTTIRGINSLRSDCQPTWVIDGAVLNPVITQNLDPFWQYGQVGYMAPLNPMMFINPYDIEEITVLKNQYETASYGSKGANGVILVTTKHALKDRISVVWNSDLGLDFPVKGVDGFKTAISHNHSVGVYGSKRNTNFAVNAFFRDARATVENAGNTTGTLSARFDTKANSVIWFGMNTILSVGSMDSMTGTAYFGQPSAMLAARYPTSYPDDLLSGWASDYDDNAKDKRIVNSMYLDINFLPSLVWKTTLGFDYYDQDRYIWYGNGTSFGSASNGAASINSSSLFRYDARTSLKWHPEFKSRNDLTLSAGADVTGDWTKYNTMNGMDFFSHVLRAKGLTIAGSKSEIHEFNHNYFSWAWFADAAWSYDGLVGLHGSLRAETVPDYEQKPVVYKSADMYWDIRKTFFGGSRGVSSLKIVAGYGEGGHNQYVPYSLFGRYVAGNQVVVDKSVEMYYDGLNRLKSREFSAGLDFGFAEDRVKVHVGVYDKNTDDNFYQYCSGRARGHYWDWAERYKVGSTTCMIENSGVEFDLNAEIVKSRNVSWSVIANGAFNKNNITGIDIKDREGHDIAPGVHFTSNNPGHPVSAMFREGEMVGNSCPHFIGGAGTTLKVYGFTLDVLGNVSAGSDILNLNAFERNLTNDDWAKYIENGDYFRLSRVSLSYDIRFNGSKIIKGLRVSASGLNLLTATGYSGWNPDVNSYAIPLGVRGLDYGSYPLAKGFILGIRANF